MKAIIRFLAAAVFFVSTISFADFSGLWVGTGEAWDSTGWKSECSEITLELFQTSTKFQRRSGGWECGTVEASLAPLEVEVHDSELWFDGTKVGDIGPSSLSATVDNGWFMTSYKASLIDVNTIIYEEKLFRKSQFLIVRGVLKKQ